MKKDDVQNAGPTDTFRLFVQNVAKRCSLMDEMEPRWNHYDLKHLLWLLDYSHCYFEDTFDALLSRKDWQGINNYFYQLNRMDIFPTDGTGWPNGFVFHYALTAIAVGDDKSVEYLFPMDENFPADENLEQYIQGVKGGYPFNSLGEILLAGIWYQDSTFLDYAIPKAEKFVAGKWRPKCEIATIAYLLALQEHDVTKASEHLENACKILHTDVDDVEKKIYIEAHGLYRLAARVLDGDEFRQLSMPEYKTFSKEYARWRNSSPEPPRLYIPFPEPADFLNTLLVADWRTIPWGFYEGDPYPLPAEWIEADRRLN